MLGIRGGAVVVAIASLIVGCAKSGGDGPDINGTIEVLSPNGGEIWAAGSLVDVRWQATGEVDFVNVELFKGELLVATIATEVENSGTFSYPLPAAQASGADYRVRVVASASDELADDSDATFAIDLRTIDLMTLTGGETTTTGDSVPLMWSKTDNIETVTVELYRDGVLELVLANSTTGTSIDWTIPSDLARDSTYVVRVADVDSTAVDSSDTEFSILNWQHRRTLTATATVSAPATEFPILIELDPASFDFSKALDEGADLRFARFEDRRAGFDVPHYVESWSAVDGARIWARVPQIPGSGTADIFMFYGLAEAANDSSFDAVFPVTVRSTDVNQVTGTMNVDAFIVEAADTVTVGPTTPLVVNARLVIIDGTLNGTGAGHAGGAAAQNGSGPGPGMTSPSAAGAGGGGYGGSGGDGGFDVNDTPGSGGSANGNAAAAIIEMGSGGGGSSLVAGGNGGAAVHLSARSVSVSGAILADGLAGVGAVSQCGGGGAGGGVLITAVEFLFTGSISAQGGNGGAGAISANDGGGAGGGGRVKLLVEDTFVNTGTVDVTGGVGGLGGDQAEGEDGAAGTNSTGSHTAGEPLLSIGPEQAVF